MTDVSAPERALASVVVALIERGRAFALVGGLAVSVRAEVRFTRDVDLAVAVDDDRDAEALVRELTSIGYRAVAVVEHDTRGRLSIARLAAPGEGVMIDLLFASSGLEAEITSRAEPMALPGIGTVPVARAEELLAMKILSMKETRLQDRLDAQRLLAMAEVDLAAVRANLALIHARGFDRGQALDLKLQSLLDARAE